uniref:Uncharacterized protein n=1 Tax=Glossina palpalis gambiensis TaxID=67801 RepID=A0A1B0B169_9MUSC
MTITPVEEHRFSVFSFNIEIDSTLADEAFRRGSKSLCTLCNEARALCNNSADSLSAAPARSSIPKVFSVALPAAYLDFLNPGAHRLQAVPNVLFKQRKHSPVKVSQDPGSSGLMLPEH